MRVVVIDDTWPLDRARAILEPCGVTVEFNTEIAGDDVVAVLTYPGGKIGVDVLDAAPNLKVVGTCSTGFDHLAVDGLAERGVWCCRVTHFCDVEVVDHQGHGRPAPRPDQERVGLHDVHFRLQQRRADLLEAVVHGLVVGRAVAGADARAGAADGLAELVEDLFGLHFFPVVLGRFGGHFRVR